MSLTAVPAYLIARRVVSTRGALVVAVLTVAVPSTFYAGTIMTENAFYPIFLVAHAGARPRAGAPEPRAGSSCSSRCCSWRTRRGRRRSPCCRLTLTAPLLIAALSRRPREVLAHRLLYAVVIGLGALAVLAELVRGRGISSLLGAYSSTTQGEL